MRETHPTLLAPDVHRIRTLAYPRRASHNRLRVVAGLLLWVLLGATACRAGAAVDAHKAFDDPPTIELAEAVARGDAERVRALAQQGADVNARGDRGVSLLDFAMLAQSPEGLRALLEAGADPNRPGLGEVPAMHTAAIARDPQYLRILLEHGGDPNARHPQTGATPLHAATGRRTRAQFEMLLKAGADPNSATRTGDTPLHAAALLNAGDQVLALLEAGADPDARNAQGATFEAYLFKTPDSKLTPVARSERDRVRQWLQARRARPH